MFEREGKVHILDMITQDATNGIAADLNLKLSAQTDSSIMTPWEYRRRLITLNEYFRE